MHCFMMFITQPGTGESVWFGADAKGNQVSEENSDYDRACDIAWRSGYTNIDDWSTKSGTGTCKSPHPASFYN